MYQQFFIYLFAVLGPLWILVVKLHCILKEEVIGFNLRDLTSKLVKNCSIAISFGVFLLPDLEM